MDDISKYIVAMDIGTSKVTVLIGERTISGRIRIIDVTDVPSAGVVRAEVRNIEQAVASISEAVSDIEKRLQITVGEAYVGISGESISCSQHGGYVFVKNADSEVTRKDVNDLSDSMGNIKVEPGQTIIHILPQNYVLDGDNDISQPVGMIGKKLEGKFNIVMCQQQSLNHLERCLKRSNMVMTEVILSSLASAESVLLDDEKELGVVVVDIGGGTTDVCIYYDKTVRYMGVIPLGGNNINRDIRSYGVLERYVEKLKVKFGSALSETIPENKVITLPNVNNIPSKEIPQKSLAAIIEARMMDIIELIAKILRDTDLYDNINGPIVLTGGCANMKDLDKLFAKHLRKDVRVASPTLYVTDDSIEKVNNPRYSTAVGLLLKGIIVGKTTKVVSTKPQPVPVAPVTAAPHVVNDYRTQDFNPYSNNKVARDHIPTQSTNTQPVNQGHKSMFSDNEPIDTADKEGNDFPPIDDSYETQSKGFGSLLKTRVKKLREFFDNEGLEDDQI